MAFSNDILVEEHNFTRTLTLNRPRKLNAVTPQMLSHLHQLYSSYKLNPNVKLIIVKGNGKAFCAGGDFSSLVQKVTLGSAHWGLPAKFFYNEFSLNHKIATHTKPQISILNGIVIGTGAGISMHGMFRVATENTMFSLPETALGISPNAGGSFFLPRLPGFFGEFLGLTGARLDGAEMLACGLATHFVHSSKLDSLEEALIQVNTSDPRVLTLVIEEFSHRPSLKENTAYNSLHIINKCFSKGTVEEILYALETEPVKNDWIFAAIQTMRKVSPIGLKVSLSSIRKGRWQTVQQCLVREYRIMAHALRRDVSKDFFEGCRAIFIEKDRNPKWEPSVLEVISEEMVEHYFSKVDDVGEYLELFGRPELPAYAVAKL